MLKINNFPRQILSLTRYPRLFLLAKRVGKNNRLGPGGRIYHHREIWLGDNIYIGPDFHISASRLTIGDGVLIGPNLLLEAHDHVFNITGKSLWDIRHEKKYGFVTIENDVWIGGNVTILKNVVIGEGCIVGAGSVVTKSLPPYTICVGNPCRPIKTRFTFEELKNHLTGMDSKYLPHIIRNAWQDYNLINE